MKNRFLMLTTSAVVLACGTLAAGAQQGSAGPTPGDATTQQQPAQQMQQQSRQQMQQQPGQQQTQRQPDQQTVGQGWRQRMQDERRSGDEDDYDYDRRGGRGYGGGMMGRDDGPGWMHHGWREGGYGRGMMERDYGRGSMHHEGGWRREGAGGGGMMGGVVAPRVIFSLMDADGDGKLTAEEFRAAHDRIFKAMDADHDGSVTMQEMLEFLRGTGRSEPQQR